MCGISGWITFQGRMRPPVDQTASMLRQMVHRGPDNQGVFQRNFISIGMNRLAIVGKAPELPFINQAGNIVIALNGEIYNWRELTRDVLGKHFLRPDLSDGAVLPYLFEVLGERLFLRLVGMFALGIFDFRSHTLYLVRDRLGIKPLYWWQQDGTVAFASEMRAFRAWRDFPPALATEWVAPYLRYRYVPHPHTLLKNVWKVSPGTVVRFRYGQQTEPSRRPYWTLGQIPQTTPSSRGEVLEQLDDLFRLVIRDHRTPLGVSSAFLLSGGVDSSLVTTVAVREAAALGPALTLEDARDPVERENALNTSRLLGISSIPVLVGDPSVSHMLDVLQTLDEPIADPTAVSLGLVLRRAKDLCRVLYSGEGADELFLGYAVYRRAHWHRAARILGGRRIPWSHLAEPLYQTYFGVGGTFGQDELPTVLETAIHESAAVPHLRLPAGLNPLRTMQAIDLLYSLPDDVLTKTDRLSMMGSMELRVPFLDHRLVEWVWALPDRYLGLMGDKPLLRRVAANVIPRRVAYRPKSGFPTPLSAWLTGAWREWVDDTINGSMAQRGFWRMDSIKALRSQINPDGSNRAGRQLFAILVLETWMTHLKSMGNVAEVPYVNH